jgi:competence protein ComEC
MKQWRRWLFRQTTLVFWLCMAFLIGMGLAHTDQLINAGWAILSLGALVPVIRKKNLWTLVCILLFGLSLGWWRGSVYMQHLDRYDDYFNHKITLIVVAGEDAAYDKYKQLTFDTRNVVVEKVGEQLTGKVGISGFGAPAIFAGDTVRVTGKLRPAHGSYQAKLSYGTIEVVQHGNAVIPELRRRFVAGMQSALPEPLASFGMGLLIGQRANLSDQVYNSLLMVGLVHIIAVSGYNLTIILRASKGLLSRYSRRLSLVFAFALIGLFLLFAGASASIVRAAMISVLSLLAAYYGRSVKPLVLIMLAAAITAWLNPFYVWTDVSWYLSFLAFFGVMIVAPMILIRLPKRLHSSLIVTVALESLCAELLTLPYILHIFGQMSFVGLVANVLVAALVPIAMLVCLAAGLAGMLVPAVAGWLAWPARILLTYMLDIADALSRIPHIFVQGLSFSLAELLLVYVLLGLVVWSLWRKLSQSQLETVEEQSIGALPKQG